MASEEDDERASWKGRLEQLFLSGRPLRSAEFLQDMTPRERSLVTFVDAKREMENGSGLGLETLALQNVVPFEENALDLLGANQITPLILYVKSKVSAVSPRDKTQKAMLSVWLAELILSAVKPEKKVLKDLSGFFDAQCLNSRVLDGMFAAYGVEDEARELFGGKYVSDQNLMSEGTDISCTAYWEAFDFEHMSPEDIQREVLPLVAYEYASKSDAEREAFLATPIGRKLATDPRQTEAVRHFMLQLIIGRDYCSEEEQKTAANTIGCVSQFDMQAALRLATNSSGNGRYAPGVAVQILQQLDMTEEALKTALDANDLDLAKAVLPSGTSSAGGADKNSNSSSIDNNTALAKRLSLTVAQRVIRDGGVVEAARILDECQTLSINDILPLFPDFVVIETFKPEICESLADCDANVALMKSELTEYSSSLANIRKEVATTSAQTMSCSTNQRCALSGLPLSCGSFCLFSSGLAYLTDVLEQVAQTDDGSGPFDECPLTGKMMIDSIVKPLTDFENYTLLPESAYQSNITSNLLAPASPNF